MGRANHSINRLLFLVFLLGFLTLPGERARAEVRVWEGTLTLPTYVEGPPDVNPPFDLFRQRSFSTYPYTTRENLTDRKVDRAWRTLNLENEYLKVTMLPDLGGRLYSCVDKTSGREMFYANPSIKYAQVAYRGAWVALGIEFNFPVSHNWVTVSPVDFVTLKNSDGSASIWVGNIDRPYGMMWRVAMTLRPGSSLLEQTVTLYNRNELRHRFYWWNTSSVESWDDSRIIYPMELTAGHGYADIDTWPVDSVGFDLSIPGNHTRGFVSRFAVGTREPFMGVYNPKTNSGMAHCAEIEEVPGKKIWSWGWDSDGRDWRKALSDNESAYLEIQAGLFRNQETYAFLEPQQFVRFHEYYMPVRNLGGFSRANRHAVVYLARENKTQGGLTVGINVNHEVSGGHVRIIQEGRVVVEEALNLRPSDTFKKTYATLTGSGAYTAEILDANSKALLSHTEGKYDLAPKSEFKLGPQEAYQIPDTPARSEGDFVEEGKNLELMGRLLPAYDCYRLGLQWFPESFALNKGAGRLGVQLRRYAEAVRYLSKAQYRVSNDPELHYYFGNAWMGLGDLAKAKMQWEGATVLPSFRPVALLHGKSDPRQAAQVFKEGMRVDLTNLDLYLGMDQALSLLESAPQERLEALESFPDQKALPTMLLHKLALTLAECGRPEEADRLFANRTFIREEFGTNIREVYLEVQLQKALASARQKRFEQARNLIKTMHNEIPGLDFTRDGLDPFLQGARFEYYLGEIESLCGNLQAARDFWQKAAKSQDYRQLYFAYLAAQRLGSIDEAGWRDKMRTGATAAKSYGSGGGHFPGIAIYAQGLLLRALGQTDEGNLLLREALYLPDKRMCHYLTRAALQRSRPAPY